MYFVVLVSDDSTNFESVLKKIYHKLYKQLIFTFFSIFTYSKSSNRAD